MMKIVDDIAMIEVECHTDDAVIECFDLKESVVALKYWIVR